MVELLGWLAMAFACVQMALAWFGHRRTVAPAEQASKAQSESTAYLQSKLGNAEVDVEEEDRDGVRAMRRLFHGRCGAPPAHLSQ